MTWIFGYGSLVWRPDFPFRQKVAARLVGWKRRFWQHSPDHRGTPDKPGRVVTLLRDAACSTVGMAYDVNAADVDRVLGALDHREKAGYERTFVQVQPLSAGFPDFQALVYVAGPDNPDYAGPATEEAIAQVVLNRIGPSGDNASYVTYLDAALRALGHPDPHVEAIAAHIRAATSPATSR